MPDAYRDKDGPIDPEQPLLSLETLDFGDKGGGEVKRYLNAKPGWDLSLSTEEIAAFRALEPIEGRARETVEAELRRVLAERVRAYHAQGLDGIANFDRGKDGQSSLAADLRNSTIASKGFQRVMPTAYRALNAFPLKSDLGGASFYFWTRIQVLGRTVFLLNQRLAAEVDGGSIVVERQFYSTRFLAAGQTLTATLPVREGTLVFYVNHSFVDRWTGFGVKAKRHIGLAIINETLKKISEDYGLCG